MRAFGRVCMYLIRQVGVGVAVEQQLHHLEAAVLGGHLEASSAVLPCLVVRGKLRIGLRDEGHREPLCTERCMDSGTGGEVARAEILRRALHSHSARGHQFDQRTSI